MLYMYVHITITSSKINYKIKKKIEHNMHRLFVNETLWTLPGILWLKGQRNKGV